MKKSTQTVSLCLLFEYATFRKRIQIIGKQKILHAISVAIVWDSFGEILSPYNDIIPMPNYSLFREFQIVGLNFPKRKNDKNFKKIDTELIFSIKNQTLLSFT